MSNQSNHSPIMTTPFSITHLVKISHNHMFINISWLHHLRSLDTQRWVTKTWLPLSGSNNPLKVNLQSNQICNQSWSQIQMKISSKSSLSTPRLHLLRSLKSNDKFKDQHQSSNQIQRSMPMLKSNARSKSNVNKQIQSQIQTSKFKCQIQSQSNLNSLLTTSSLFTHFVKMGHNHMITFK